MATLSAIARPYAQAAFEWAAVNKELPAWGAMLETVSETVRAPAISKLLENTTLSSQQWFSLLSDILAPYLNDQRKNFLQLLTENKRLSAIPAIADLFKEYQARHNETAEVEVTTAVPLTTTQQQQLTAKLTLLFKQEVNLRSRVDENILGGAIVRAGDKVIDGSVRGQLTRLLEFAIR